MLKIQSEYIITIDGETATVLKDVCEVARIYLANHRHESFAAGGMDERERGILVEFIDAILLKIN